jgi:hypothetical protein
VHDQEGSWQRQDCWNLVAERKHIVGITFVAPHDQHTRQSRKKEIFSPISTTFFLSCWDLLEYR